MRYQFEDFALDTDRRDLLHRGEAVALEPQVFDLLVYLISNRDRVVTKDDLFSAVWNDRLVSESSLTTRMNAARAALDDNGEAQRLIRTLRGRGYRFLGHVQEFGNAAAGASTPESSPLAAPDHPSIAVLPFENMSGDPEEDYFADGMVDDLLSELSRVRWLFVIARHSSFLYRARSADVRQIGRELGVRYVVEGSVRKAGTRVRITAQLIETAGGSHIWADRYEGDLRDIFALQDEITAQIAAAVETNVQAAEIKRARAKPTDSLTAYDFYLRALPAYFGQTPDDYRRAEALLENALGTDPEYAEVLGTLTDSVAGRALQGWHEGTARGKDEACRIATRALAAGADNSTCVVGAAFTYGVIAHRFDEALDLADRALMLHPNSVLVRNRTGAVYTACGEYEKAIVQCEAARRLNPRDSKKAATATNTTLAAALYHARRFEGSLQAGRRAVAFAPHANTARKFVAMSLAQLGRIGEAKIEIEQLIKYQPNASLSYFRSQSSFRHKWMYEIQLEGLRKAGLRES